jgi:nucleoside-diphosphate-sugar epimerase
VPGRALVIGGTGPTGPFVVEGLADRGYEVTILHGGQHEVEFSVSGIRHLHADPHFTETLERGLADEGKFDLVIAQYGRLKVIARSLAGRTERLVAVGGATGIYAGDGDARWGGLGRPASFPEATEILNRDESASGMAKIGLRMVQAMDALFEGHDRADYSATYIGYPLNYGPRNPGQYDWSVVRRLLDGRRRLVIADGGTKLESRVLSENAARAVLLVVDKPDLAAGQRYTVADRYVYSMRQRIEYIAACLNVEVELVDMPYDVAWPCHPLWRRNRGHLLCQSTRIRDELGYREAVEQDVGLRRSVEWLAANRPEPGGQVEQQLGDPFDYPREDALIAEWLHATARFRDLDPGLPEARHQYRHPKKPGETWQPGARP